MSKTIQKNSESESGNQSPQPELVKKTAKTSTSNSAKPLATLSLLLSLAALGSISYISWRGLAIEQQLPETATHIQRLDSQLARQSHQLTATRNGLTPIQQQTDNLAQRNERLLARVDQLSGKVRSLEGSTRVDWHLAEIEYLLRLANQRLLMSSDMHGAKKLLSSADDMLHSLDDYDLFAVREALAEDIAVLNAVQEFDQEGVYLQLQALGEQIQSLELLEVDQFKPSKDVPNNQVTETASEDKDWKSTALSTLLHAWQGFADLFRFTSSRERPIEVLLTPEQENMVRQNLRLLIEQSKLSLLARQQTIYKDSLTQAAEWLNKYFSRSGVSSQAVLKELSLLATLDINPELPSINRALETLKHYQLQPATQKKALIENIREKPPRESSVFTPPVDISTGINSESGEPRS